MKYIDWVVPFDQYLALHPTPEIQLDKAIHIIICGILVHSHDMSTYEYVKIADTPHYAKIQISQPVAPHCYQIRARLHG